MDFSAFSHGQIESKLWLCEKLEPYLYKDSKICILACWYNLLAFLLMTRKPKYYKLIIGIDKDESAIETANKICNTWMVNYGQYIKNYNKSLESMRQIDYADYDVIINTSVEDIRNNNWYDNIPENKMVVFQSTNLDINSTIKYDNWDIVNPNYSLDMLQKKYPMKQILHSDVKEFDYGDLKYNRFMIIGKK